MWDYIYFGYCVEEVKKVDDFLDFGDWIVIVWKFKIEYVDMKRVNYVIVVNGYFYWLNVLKCLGLDKFVGKVIYIYDYKDFKDFVGKKVLVVGVGNLVCDVVCEISWYVE